MSRTTEAHYSITVERVSRQQWRWHVAHWPECWQGYNGLVYPASDWSASGTAKTREAANRKADEAVAQHKEDLTYAEQYEHREVMG